MQTSLPLILACFVLAFVVPAIRSVNSQDATYAPSTPATLHVWTGADRETFIYPEQSETEAWGIPTLLAKPNFAVAISGGGYRATTCALGWVSALTEMGVLRHARYLSSNSGGSWFNAVFSYSPVPDSVLLQPTIPPEELTVNEARSSLRAGSYTATIANASIIAEALRGVINAANNSELANTTVGGWSIAVASAFLQPYQLGLQASSITAIGTRGAVHERIAAIYPNATLYTADARRKPYPIMLGSTYLQDEQKFRPFEFTPLYSGIPPLNNDTEPIPLGAGFVETLGLNSPAPADAPSEPSPEGAQTVSVTPVYVSPLMQMVGISSSFVAVAATADTTTGQELTGTETMEYWNLQDYTGTRLPFADGGGIDNTAITPLLRRRVERIVACIATVTSPVSNTIEEWATSQNDVSGLFGSTPAEGPDSAVYGVPTAMWNELLQVFEEKEFRPFFDAIKKRVAAGGPAWYRKALRVLENPKQGIPGNWTADVLFVLNQNNTAWKDALPSATRRLVENGEGGVADDFPLVSTFNTFYSNLTAQLLTQTSAFSMLQLREEVLDLCGGDCST